METWEAMDKTQKLIGDHGLVDWHFRFDRSVNRFGQCDHNNKIISLSKHLVTLNTWDEVSKTVIHEIAHALVGPNHGHDDVWKAKMIELGQVPSRTYDEPGNGRVVWKVIKPWRAICPNHGTVGRYHRRKKLMCGRCYRLGHKVFLYYIKAPGLDNQKPV